jgi:hypothetical protein
VAQAIAMLVMAVATLRKEALLEDQHLLLFFMILEVLTILEALEYLWLKRGAELKKLQCCLVAEEEEEEERRPREAPPPAFLSP